MANFVEPAVREKIRMMLEAGHTQRAIAAECEVAKGTVTRESMILRREKRAFCKVAITTTAPAYKFDCYLNARTRWTEAEKVRLRELAEQRVDKAVVERALGRPMSAILYRAGELKIKVPKHWRQSWRRPKALPMPIPSQPTFRDVTAALMGDPEPGRRRW